MRAAGNGTKRKIQLAGRPMRRMRVEDMLSNALRLFAEVGYANATVKSIAAAADINPALLYYYYDNKESLFIAALRNAINAALDTHGGFGIIERSVDPAALIRYWFEKNRSLMTPLGQMLKLMIEYRTSGSRIASVDRLIEKFYDAELSLLSRAIKRGIKSRQFRAVDVDRTAQFVSTHLDGLVISAVLRPNVDVTRSLDHLEKVLFRHLSVDGASVDLEAAA